MIPIKSIITGELLHLIVRAEDFKPGRVNVCEDHQFLQCALLNLDKGVTFKAHKHVYHGGEKEVKAQEAWAIFKGSVKVMYYDTDNYLMRTEVLKAGDISMTFHGGHNYEILEDGTIVAEMKSGPYLGFELDKQFI